ncbi:MULTISPECIES: hypothetical protein [unclassified Crossiella]|uniref:hypothetical protein n=1 Tax=unclassified Crossiella TaxID=2620835 RepID=UPI001FFEC2A6|nr:MULTISPECIES: hypothetical protein [unclassified Crossiella]MCK2243735.1 hypothetical protein [Crossiella sp. S99.2]MCK2257594.1 hypothetical protein [Crossiella sp. S99.1]
MAQVTPGHQDGALEVARSIDSPDVKASVLLALAKAPAAEGRSEEAIRLASAALEAGHPRTPPADLCVLARETVAAIRSETSLSLASRS